MCVPCFELPEGTNEGMKHERRIRSQDVLSLVIKQEEAGSLTLYQSYVLYPKSLAMRMNVVS